MTANILANSLCLAALTLPDLVNGEIAGCDGKKTFNFKGINTIYGLMKTNKDFLNQVVPLFITHAKATQYELDQSHVSFVYFTKLACSGRGLNHLNLLK